MDVEDLIEEVEIVEVISQPQSIELPSEIWFDIFDLLSVSNRRNIRLVCKQWFEVCCRFHEREAFFFNASYTIPTIVKIIVDCGREFVNLKLQSYVLHKESHCLWETCGSKIRSLELNFCDFDGPMLGHIIYSCPNMTEFRVNGGFYNLGGVPFPPMFLRTKFQHPEEETLKREKLEKLDFDAPRMPIIYPDLERFYLYFPNLKSLNVTLCSKDPMEKEKDLTHFEALLALVSKETSKIDTLYVDFESSEIYMFSQLPVLKLKCMAEHDLSKLKDVGMRFEQCTLNDDSLKTILRYKFWTSLRITLHRIAQEKFNKFLIKLLTECPLLTTLGTYWKITKNSQFFDVFPAVVKSRLKTLAFEIDDRSLPEAQQESLQATAKTRLKNLTKNDTVRHLTVDCAEACEFSTIFIEHFPKVRHLKVPRGDLQDAFKFLPDLLSIDAGENSSYYEYSLFNKTPRTSVPGLQYMSISIFSFEKFAQIKFPDLKFLNLTLSSDELFVMRKTGEFDEYYEEDEGAYSFPEKIASILTLVTQDAPNLRGLRFEFDDLNDRYLKCETGHCSRDALAAFFKSCQQLHQLRYVGVEVASYTIGEEFCKHHITECYKGLPSLRAAYCTTRKEKLASFFNVLENKVEFNEDVSRKKSLQVDVNMMDYWLECR